MTLPENGMDPIDSYEPRSRHATAVGAQAFARLLALAEQRRSGQIARVVQFIAATYNGEAFKFVRTPLAGHRDQRRHAALS